MSVTSATAAPKHHTSSNTHQTKIAIRNSAGTQSSAQTTAAQRRLPAIHAGGKENSTQSPAQTTAATQRSLPTIHAGGKLNKIA